MILRAALEEFAAAGFAGTTLAAVARRAGVARALVHYHYTSKEDLWRRAVASAFEAFAANVLDPLQDLSRETLPAGPRKRSDDVLRDLALTMARQAGAHRALIRIMMDEINRPGPRADFVLDTYLVPLYRRAADHWRRNATPRRGYVTYPVEFILPVAFGAMTHIFLDAPSLKRAFGVDATTTAAIDQFGRSLGDFLVKALLVSA